MSSVIGMADDGIPQPNKGIKRPRPQGGDLGGESPMDVQQEGHQPKQQEQQQQQQPAGQPAGGGGAKGRRGGDRNSAANLPRAYSGISPLPQQHPRLANTDLPGCIVRQDFHCAVLSDACGQEGVNQCLSFHPNGLAVVQLAPTHPAVGDGDSAIVTADFDAGGCNVLESATVKGKKKKGALQLHPTTVLCSISTKAGKHFKVCTGMFGELIQANKTLVENPGLMSEDPLGLGWLAIIRLKPRDLRRLQQALGVVGER